MKPTPNSDSKVTLETLLRLKRAERPTAEFWVEFEAGLRRKQLVAMVERRTPWQVVMGGLSRWAWVGMPAGAVAAGVFAWSATRPAVAPQVTVAAAEAVQPSNVAEVAEPASSLPVSVQAEPQQVIASAEAVPVAPEVKTVTGSSWGRRSSVEGAFAFLASGSSLDGKAPAFNANLSLEPAYRGASRAEVAAVVDKPEVTEEVSAWSDPKKARLMAYADTTLSSSSTDRLRSSRTQDRAARRLSQQGLPDSMGRLDVDGGRLTIRF